MPARAASRATPPARSRRRSTTSAQLLSFLPQNNLEDPPFVATADDAHRQEPSLRTLVPDHANKPYDIKELIKLVVDDGVFLEVHSLWARNIVCGFARFGGRSVGIVANQPAFLAGCLDIDSSKKAARFVRFCDAFNLPIVTFVDVPGFLPGARPGVRRHHHATARSCSTPSARPRSRR